MPLPADYAFVCVSEVDIHYDIHTCILYAIITVWVSFSVSLANCHSPIDVPDRAIVALSLFTCFYFFLIMNPPRVIISHIFFLFSFFEKSELT